MNNKYEYIQHTFAFGDLEELNKLASVGFKIIFVERLKNLQAYSAESYHSHIALLERDISKE